MTAKQILVAARKLIRKKENWQQGGYGSGSGPFCASGAIMKVGGKVGDPAYNLLQRAMGVRSKNASSVSSWNDFHTHKKVMAAFTKAIKAAK